MIDFQNPNLPDRGTVLICDKSVSLSEKFEHFIPTVSISALPKSMRYHTDLQILYMGKGVFLSSPETYDYYRENLAPFGAKVIRGEKNVGSTYGEDCAYNILMMGKYAFHNTKFTPKIAKDYFEKNNIKLIHVSQGYTKCAVAPISENAAITADVSIKKAMDEIGIDCLLIEWEGVSLPGFSYGFFGGCSGRISNNEFFVCGTLKNHPSVDKIKSFLEKQDMVLIEMDDDVLRDIGSFIIA